MYDRQEQIKYRETGKFNLWTRYYTDKTDKVCYMNATRAAMRAYRTKSYSLAGVIGHKNVKKYKVLALITLDQNGVGFMELMKIGIQKVLKGSYRDWQLFMVKLGYWQQTNT